MSQLLVLSVGLAGIGLYVFPWNSWLQWLCAFYIVLFILAINLSWLGTYLYTASRNKKKHKK
jgi:protein-S-isoprenylcysteine O-methyltransferase Ste14